MFDYFHIAMFVVAILSGILNVANAKRLIGPEYSKDYSLEKLLGIAAISLFWIFYGIYTKVNNNILLLEGFAFCLLLMAFIAKLNQTKINTLFGRPVPGHGKDESRLAKKVKYFFAYSIGIAILIFVIFALLFMVHG
jgi:hypothetical protein